MLPITDSQADLLRRLYPQGGRVLTPEVEHWITSLTYKQAQHFIMGYLERQRHAETRAGLHRPAKPKSRKNPLR